MTVVCCAEIGYDRRLTACVIYYDVEVVSATSGSAVVPGAGAATPGGVDPGHWAAATHWEGPGGESDVGEAAGPGLTGTYGAGIGLAGAMMAGPGGAGVDHQGGVTETEIL